MFDEEEGVVDGEDLQNADEVIPYNYTITAFGADYPVDALVKRLEQKDIFVPTFGWSDEESKVVGFQREYVWPRTKADKFIESLLLGLPVPGIFLVKEPNGRLLVLDGHQRLKTLQAYYDGVIDGEEFKLGADVQTRYVGKRYKELEVEDRRRLDDAIIHATIIKQEDPAEDLSSIYIIFQRLNSGGVNLQPQEIRVALYHGELVRVLKALNDHPSWRTLFGKKSRRLKDMELIVRALALYYYGDKYEAPMTDFLNKYMATNRNLQKQSEERLETAFKKASDLALSAFGASAFKPKRSVNAAVADSILVGLAKRIAQGNVEDVGGLKAAYRKLMMNPSFISATETGTSQEANVETRLRLATEAFAAVK